MKLEHQTPELYRYENDRRGNSSPRVRFLGSYRPTGAVYESRPGDLDHWLTERYCLFSQGPGKRLYRCDIRHFLWPLQKAEAKIQENTLLSPLGLEVPNSPPLVHFAKKLKVRATHLFEC